MNTMLNIAKDKKKHPKLWQKSQHPIPLLENGDHLSHAEFTRRYEAMPHLKKAELIEGVVYMTAAVRITHGRAHAQIIGWLSVYSAKTPGLDLADNASVHLGTDTEVQPDVLLRLEPSFGGKSHTTSKDYLTGPPELIVEIAGSSAAYDLHNKLNIYQKYGVQEYLVWRIYDREIDWFVLHQGKYQPLEPNEQGIIESKIFSGLKLSVPSLLAGDLATVLDVLQAGMKTD